MIDYQSKFAALAEAFARKTLPVDSANWDVWQPPEYDATIAEILGHFDDSSAAMPEDVCELLAVPSGTTYARGSDRIREFAGPSAAGSVSVTA